MTVCCQTAAWYYLNRNQANPAVTTVNTMRWMLMVCVSHVLFFTIKNGFILGIIDMKILPFTKTLKEGKNILNMLWVYVINKVIWLFTCWTIEYKKSYQITLTTDHVENRFCVYLESLKLSGKSGMWWRVATYKSIREFLSIHQGNLFISQELYLPFLLITFSILYTSCDVLWSSCL